VQVLAAWGISIGDRLTYQ